MVLVLGFVWVWFGVWLRVRGGVEGRGRRSRLGGKGSKGKMRERGRCEKEVTMSCPPCASEMTEYASLAR